MNKNNDNYSNPFYANYVLVVLLIAYILSFVDRNILAVLVGPIRQQFEISDFQFSIISGWAFTLFYIVLGLPIGWLADRFSRKWIITTGVFFWSVMTCVSGFTRTFGSFFVARVGVGVGEAALSPAAYSILSDYFSPSRLRWATAIYAMGITLGAGLSYRIGGWLFDRLSTMDFSHIPLISDMHAWQLTFVVVGLPGFIVVLLLFFVREPVRHQTLQQTENPPPLREVIAYMRQRWQAFSSLIFGVCMKAVIGYGTMLWYVEFLVRTYGMSKTDAGIAFGNIFLIGGTAGTLAGAFFASWLQRRGYVDANMRMIMLSSLLVLIPAITTPLMPGSELAIVLAWVVITLHYTHFGVAMAGLQLITPNRMRAQVSALLLFMTNLFGLALGGSFVAFFTDFVFADDQALRYSLSIVAAIVYPLAGIVVAWGLQYYRRALAELS